MLINLILYSFIYDLNLRRFSFVFKMTILDLDDDSPENLSKLAAPIKRIEV